MVSRVRRAVFGRLAGRVTEAVGGPARRHVIVLLACVLALNAADTGVIGAVVKDLKGSLGIGNFQIGILTAVPSAVGALATVPVGRSTDHVRRVPLLVVSIVLWSLAMIAGGLARSYLWLLLSRAGLGAVTATAGPTVASLFGDLFPAAERGRLYGYVLGGELVGAGFGLLVGNGLAGLMSWRVAFWFVAGLGFALAVVLRRSLPEPPRGGQAGIVGDEREGDPEDGGEPGVSSDAGPDRTAPREREDPAVFSLWHAARYVLSIRTNVILIIASAIGYFFFAGLRTFALVFVQDRYGLGGFRLVAFIVLVGAGALGGVFLGGHVADRLIGRGRVSGRVLVAGGAYIAAAVAFAPGLLTRGQAIALPVFICAGAALAAANPPLDAARLDIVHFRLWGQAEGIRTILRLGAEAIAPVVFGLVSQVLAGSHPGHGGQPSAVGLQRTFLIALVPLLVNGLMVLRARHSYPGDAARTRAMSPGRS